MSDLSDRIILLYDETVEELSAEDPAVLLSDVREAMLPGVIDILEAADRDIEAEAQAWLTRVLDPERARRSRSLRRSLEYVLDCLSGQTLDGLSDAELRIAYPTGDSRGVDRILRHWRVKDLQEMAFARYRGAADAMKEAREIDAIVQDLVSSMSTANATTIGDLLEHPHDDAA